MSHFAFDAKRLFHNSTGLGNYARTLVSNLARFYPEHGYHLFTPQYRDRLHISAEFEAAPCQVHAYQGFFPNLWRTRLITKDLKCLKPTLYHGLSHELPIGLSKVNILGIVTIHDLIFLKYPQGHSLIDRKIYDAKWKHSIYHADTVIAISKSTADDLQMQYNIDPKRIKVVYQACQSAFYQPKPTDSEVLAFCARHQLPPKGYLLSVGSLTERKNLMVVLHGLSLIDQDQRPPLVVVGTGRSYKIILQKAIESLGLVRDVRFWEDQTTPTETLRLLYAGARATIFVSHYEGFGLPVAESLLTHTPVITSHTSSMPEAGGPGALYVSPDAPQEVAEAIQRLFSDDQLCSSLAQAGYAYAKAQFDPYNTAKQMMGIYGQLGR
jgi:glycosyltransferase involved in cell wall biosynthesis